MGNKFKKFLSTTTAGLMALSMTGVAVMADEPTATETTGPSLKITKELTVPKGTAVPDYSYTFNSALTTVNGVTNTTDKNFDLSNFSIGKTELAAATGVDNEEGTTTTYTATKDVTLPTYDHAGQYIYTFTESSVTETDDKDTITEGEESYTVYVNVENKANGLEVTSIQAKSNAVGAGKEGGASGTTLTFTNTYTRSTSTDPDENTDGLIIKHITAGDMGDKTKPFTYSLTLSDSNAKVYRYHNENGKEELTNLSSFTLDDGDYISVVGAAVGTKYVITPTKDDQYDIKTPDYTADPAEKGVAPENIGSTTEPVMQGNITAALDTVTFTHTLNDGAIETGNFINNMPFIALIAVALGGFVAYIAAKRRRA